MDFPKKTIAAIDIGTNSAHMVVAEMDHIGEMRILDSDKVTLRLGQAIDESGNLTEDAIRRTIEAVGHMREIIAPYNATIRAVATHATRSARNHRRLLRDLRNLAGVEVEKIDGIEEARLTFLGMRYGMALVGVPCLGVDVGGGSTELIVANDDTIHFVSSLRLGAVTLTQKYFGHGYTPEACAALAGHIRSRLVPVAGEAAKHEYRQALASSGTAKALAAIHSMEATGSAMGDPNGYILPAADLSRVVERLTSLLTPGKIRAATGIDGSRAEIILAGAMILDQISRAMNVSQWVVTSYGLREGLVADTFYRAYGDTAPPGELPDIQWHSVLQFARRLRLNEGHAVHVKRLATRIHLQLVPRLYPEESADSRDRMVKLLRASAYLREAGKFLSAPQYHRHSAYLIANSRLPGFTETERMMMGLIARFHRKALPSADHAECAELTAPEVQRLRYLAGVIRMAAALDRTRQGRVVDVEITGGAGGLTVTLKHAPGQFPEVELHKVRLEHGALEKSWGVKLEFGTRAVEPDGTSGGKAGG